MRTEQHTGITVPDAAAGGADTRALVLHAAAFGAGPGPDAVVLPPARTLQEAWWRAVAHGAAGFYARAGADLAALCRAAEAEARPAWAALAESTAASLLRQRGGHARAAVYDGRALARLAGGSLAPASRRDGDGSGVAARAQARADALTGLAADALGRGDWRSSRRLLALVTGGPGFPGPAAEGGLRATLRRHWVAAEAAMTEGDGEAAVRESRAAHAVIDAAPAPLAESVRHRIKTALVGAAAEAVAGRGEAAALSASRARAAATEAGLLPLRWAASMLLAGAADGGEAADAAREARHCAEVLRARGGGDPRAMRGYG